MGGLGLNLTGADTVIFFEHDWNPMKDLQVSGEGEGGREGGREGGSERARGGGRGGQGSEGRREGGRKE